MSESSPSPAMLFCPPQPPVVLSRAATACIGRHSTCELTIVRSAVSRRHAEVCFEGQGYVLQDLGSRNGTYVNGQRVQGSIALSSGDRIEIGPMSVTFCELEGSGTTGFDSHATNDAQTVFFERAPTSNEAFQGSLREIPAFAVCQVLEMGAKTGILEITANGETARIWFEDGAPIHAESEKNLGADAALSIVNANEGEFRFDSHPIEVETTIQASITELLLEACRLEDERGH